MPTKPERDSFRLRKCIMTCKGLSHKLQNWACTELPEALKYLASSNLQLYLLLLVLLQNTVCVYPPLSYPISSFIMILCLFLTFIVEKN